MKESRRESDPCRFAYFSDQQGLIFKGAVIHRPAARMKRASPALNYVLQAVVFVEDLPSETFWWWLLCNGAFDVVANLICIWFAVLTALLWERQGKLPAPVASLRG